MDRRISASVDRVKKSPAGKNRRKGKIEPIKNVRNRIGLGYFGQ